MQFILDCTTTFISAFCCFFMLFQKYRIKKEKIIIKTIGIIFIMCVAFCVILLKIPPLNMLLTVVLFFVIVYLFYQCELRTVIVYSLIYSMIGLAADAFGVVIVSSFYHNTITETLGSTDFIWHHYIWDWIIQLFLSRITAILIKKNDNINAKWYEFTFYIFLLFFEIIFFVSASNAVKNYMSGNFLIYIMFGFIILDICTMVMLSRISSLRELEKKMNLMQQQEFLNHQMYQELHKKYTETRRIAHDINKHINSLKELFEKNLNQQGKKYLEELKHETEHLHPIIKNQNPMLEIILNTTFSRCQKNNIEFKMEIDDCSISFISDMDMTTIFSNLLDNAIDACMEISKSQRKIRMTLCSKKGLIVVRITNSCAEQDNYTNKLSKTTKANHSGIGLSNVRKVVKKYNGVLNLSRKNQYFSVSLTFFINN